MSEPLDEAYLIWLYSQVASTRSRSPNKTHWKLVRVLLSTKFVWLIPNDDNRVEDGLLLRDEFLTEQNLQDDGYWRTQACSVLEVLVALSRRCNFEAQRSVSWWFWLMLENLNLHHDNDSEYTSDEEVKDKIDTFIWRTYQLDGQGGLFPLDRPAEDQRRVELWYQLNAYLLEKEYM